MGWPKRTLLLVALGVFVLAQWSPRVPAPLARVSDKLEHAALYALFALAVWPFLPAAAPLPRAGALLSGGLLVAVTMEAGQIHFPQRTPDAHDVVADLAGLLAAAGPLAWRQAALQR